VLMIVSCDSLISAKKDEGARGEVPRGVPPGCHRHTQWISGAGRKERSLRFLL
jgi:hypothetical protein